MNIDQALDIDLSGIDPSDAAGVLARIDSGEIPAKRGAGRPTGPRQFDRQYQPQEIWGKHHEILRMHHLGFKNVDIAASLRITPQVVSYVVNSKLGKIKIDQMNGAADAKTVEIKDRFREGALDAQSVLEELMWDTDQAPALRAKIAADQLDRAGFTPIKQIKVEGNIGIFSTVDVDAMAKDALEVARSREMIVDAEVVEVKS